MCYRVTTLRNWVVNVLAFTRVVRFAVVVWLVVLKKSSYFVSTTKDFPACLSVVIAIRIIEPEEESITIRRNVAISSPNNTV
jgi:hypothetical protein